MSYGRASRGPVWPKYLALGAGFFVLFVTILFSLFWFLTRIPVPNNSAVALVLPADTNLDANMPLLWKQSHEFNKPLPTIAGLAKNNDNTFSEYAIRLSPLNALLGRTGLWHLESQENLNITEYKTPYQFFGWPWELAQSQFNLEIKPSSIFNQTPDELQDLHIKGIIEGNKWKTDFLLVDYESLEMKDDFSNGVVFTREPNNILKNFFRYHGSFVTEKTGSGALSWRFDANKTTVNLQGVLDPDRVREEGGVFYKTFTMPDGTTARAIYATSSLVDASSTGFTFNIGNSFLNNQNNVNELTCSGDVIAVLDEASVNNICSWIDICYFDFKKLVFMVEGGYLSVCGY